MDIIRTHAGGYTPLTSNFLIELTLEREQLPCCFLESSNWIFYNEDEEIWEGGGAR